MESIPEVWKTLAANGPWAIMFGFLLWQVLKAWSNDRTQLNELIGKFQITLEGLKIAVEHLTNRLEDDFNRRT